MRRLSRRTACRARGLVGHQVNDLEIATVMPPAITTVRSPAALYEERAVRRGPVGAGSR